MTNVIADEADRFAAILTDCPPDASVPTCPGWTATDLYWHLTKVHTFWSTILREHVVDQAGVDAVEAATPERPDTIAEMAPMRSAATKALVAELDRQPNDAPLWSWWPADQTVGFTRRMQTAEIVVHRVDAELTTGVDHTPITPDVAAAVIDHVIDVMHAWVPDAATTRVVGVVAFEATDSDLRAAAEVLEWSGVLPWNGEAATGISLRRTPAEDTAIASVRGTVDDLAKWVWSRPGEVTLTGDDAVIEAVRRMREDGIG